MHRFGSVRVRRVACAAFMALAAISLQVAGLAAQSLTEGSLTGDIVGKDGRPVPSTQLTLENAVTGSSMRFKADRTGRFTLSVLAPGNYSLLAEQIGFQPVRQREIHVFAGQAATVRVILERRPPPITSVMEQPIPHQGVPGTRTLNGQLYGDRDLHDSPYRADLTDVARSSSIVSAPRDGRWGYAQTAGGLAPEATRLWIDGLPGTLLRHPGAPGDPVGAPVYPRALLEQGGVVASSLDDEWPASGGTVLSGFSRRGGNHFRFSPYVTWSGTPGIAQRDNSGDSSVTSLQAGAVVSGALIRDVAQFYAGVDYQTLERPTANPWEQDSSSFGGSAVSLRSALPTVALDSFGVDVGALTRPVVRTYRGGSGYGRIDWRLSDAYAVTFRGGFARWKEQSPQFAEDLVSGMDGLLQARSFSGAASFTANLTALTNELRVGYRLDRRDWSGSTIPATYLVGDGLGIGESPLLPGSFRQRAIDLHDAVQFGWGSRQHFKLGLTVSFINWKQDYLYGSHGIFDFGDLDQFGDANGVFYQATGPSAVSFNSTEFGLFLMDAVTISPSLQFFGGLRFDRQKFPRNQIPLNVAFRAAFGTVNNFTPFDKNNTSPRLGFIWDAHAAHRTVLRGGVGFYYGELNPAMYAEALLDTGVVVRRGLGNLSSWPVLPDAVTAPTIGPRLTIFDRNFADPRTSKFDLGLSRSLASALTLTVTAAYHHTDYLPRRTDINLAAGPSGSTNEGSGRPIFGTLVQQGGLITAQPGSNRRLPGFDQVMAINPTGAADYYEVGLGLDRTVARGLSVGASYTWSRTRDNWLLGASGDPSDQLSPFPLDPIASEWVKGRSDFDLPHRARLLARYTFPGRYGVTVGASYRFRSGLPFTPGFRPGVDVNGDGSGGNDPAFVDPNTPGLAAVIAANPCLSAQAGKFAGRNSCRDRADHALDLHAEVGLPVHSLQGQVQLTLDLFNLVTTATGIRDHALVLIDPTQTLTTDPQGNVTLPLIANPNFGSLLSRRGEPRTLRVGLRLGY